MEPIKSVSAKLSLAQLELWESGEAVTYADLPGWDGPPWSFLLVPGWEELRGRNLAEIVTEQWARTAEILLDDLEALAPRRWAVTRYEALLSDPAWELRRLFGFLDLAWDAAIGESILPLVRARAARPLAVRDELTPHLPRAAGAARRASEWMAWGA